MLTKEQAQAASEAVLQPEHAEQNAEIANTQRRRQLFAQRQWAGIGALIGFAVGSLAGYYLIGHWFPTGIVGLAAGFSLGRLRTGQA